MTPRRLTRAVLAAGSGVAFAIFLMTLAVWRAVGIEPIAPVPDDDAPPAFERRVSPRANISEAALTLAADTDPFRPERTRPVPGEVMEEDPAANVDRVASIVRLIGTVVLPDDGGLAMLRVGEDPARVVRVGQLIGALRLVRVEPGRATLVTTDGAEFVVRVDRRST
jgi:hypothetical protein